jgi:hypothetical protein
MELPALTLLPIPFLELLDEAGPPGNTFEPSANSAVVRDRLVLRALDIRDAFKSGRPNNLDSTSAQYVWLVGTGREACAEAPAQAAWADAVRNLSDDTAAYLSSGELEQLWSTVSSSPCYREVPGEEQAWVGLFTAIAHRDAPAIVRLGTGLLATPSSHSPGDLAYLTTVTAAAYVKMGERAQAQSLLRIQWSRIDHAGQFDLALRDLRALTRPANPAAAGSRL